MQRGWNDDTGDHYVVRRNGDIELDRDRHVQGAHVAGQNKGNLGICLIGGCNNQMQVQNNFTLTQRKPLFSLINQFQQQYTIDEKHVTTHSHWNPAKACPVIKINRDDFAEKE